jgi:succinoglycan biosynthesis transport protein ExoP
MVRMAPEAVAGDGDLDLRTLAGALWRRKGWILWPTILVAVLSTIGVNWVTPRYKSEARILYDGRENAFLRPEVDKTLNADRPPADAETLTSQVQIVLSRQLALDVIRQLKLGNLPEFDPILREATVLHQITSILGIARDYAAMSPDERVL